MTRTSRRNFLKAAALGGAGTFAFSHQVRAGSIAKQPSSKPRDAFRILHLTDIHIRPEYEAPRRYKHIMDGIRKSDIGKIDLVLNGGDSIYAADYGHITRERMLEQWKVWDQVVMPPLKNIEMLSALGNHDMWWAAPEKASDPMFGKDYVLKRLGQAKRYMSIERGGWLILTLDCNNRGKLDEEQLNWLHAEAERLPDTPLLILSHQPILMAESVLNKGINANQRRIIDPFVERRSGARPVHFVSGHEHLLDTLGYANIHFHCNGALSGAWWEPHIEQKDCSVKGTPMGYAVIDIYPDGGFDNHYYDVTDCKDGQILV